MYYCLIHTYVKGNNGSSLLSLIGSAMEAERCSLWGSSSLMSPSAIECGAGTGCDFELQRQVGGLEPHHRCPPLLNPHSVFPDVRAREAVIFALALEPELEVI